MEGERGLVGTYAELEVGALGEGGSSGGRGWLLKEKSLFHITEHGRSNIQDFETGRYLLTSLVAVRKSSFNGEDDEEMEKKK